MSVTLLISGHFCKTEVTVQHVLLYNKLKHTYIRGLLGTRITHIGDFVDVNTESSLTNHLC